MTTVGTPRSSVIIRFRSPVPIGPLVPRATTTTGPSFPWAWRLTTCCRPLTKARDSTASSQNPAGGSGTAAPSITESPSAYLPIGVAAHGLPVGGGTVVGAGRAAVLGAGGAPVVTGGGGGRAQVGG